MTKILLAAAMAGLATAAVAQNVPPAQVAVVDMGRVSTECTACKAANAALQGQIAALRTRQQQLGTGLQGEGNALQTAINALQGKQPDAALQNRIKAFQTREQNANQELARQQEQIQRNQAYIQQQIGQRLDPILTQVMQRRGANLLVDTAATLKSAPTVDVTNDVLTALNAALPSVVTTAPAAPAQPAPQGR